MNALTNFTFIAWLFLCSTFAIAQEAGTELYQNEIKPLFRERCFACHGALKQESDLRVDTVQAMNDHGVLDSGDLLGRLTSDDDEVRMPPEGEPLLKHEIAIIETWIADGAAGPVNEQAEADPLAHWSFQKIKRPALPELSEPNPIDAFLTQRHSEIGLKPQPSARRSLLLRRLYLDIVGLPPTSGQIQSERPLSEIIDSLLSSPQYGERWGRHWMDVWRYSEWYGLGKELRNSQKHMWHWRDWIIRSLNEDKGYDQMITEMLAGDEIAPQDLETVAATGFLARNYYLFNRTTWLDNAIEHTGKAFLGLTMNCAKCHDHKYDPIAHDDYYRFRAIFEPHHVRLDALPGETDFNKNALPRVYDDNLAAVTYLHQRGDPSQPAKDNPIAAGPPKFLSKFAPKTSPIDLPVEAWAPGVREYVQTDQLARARSNVEAARKSLQQVPVHKDPPANSEVSNRGGAAISDDFEKSRPEIWKTIGSDWRYQGGLLSQTRSTTERSGLHSRNHHPRDFDATLRFQTTAGEKWKSTGIRFDADESGENHHTVYASAFAGGPKVQLAHTIAGRSVYPGNAKVNRAIELNREYELNVKVREDLVNVALDGQFLFAHRLPQRRNGSIELFAFDCTADFYSVKVEPLAADVVLKETGKQSAQISVEQTLGLAKAQLVLAEAELASIKARIKADNVNLRRDGDESQTDREDAGRLQLKVQLARAEVDLLKADAAKKEPAIKRRDQATAALKAGKLRTHEPLRGSQRALNQKTDKTSQHALVYPKTSTGRRTALARWITHRDNPLAARVAVNHIWMRHFGTPLVESMFDFGRRSAEPLHRELLDYLAVELIDSGWSTKHLHCLILTSKAWQRSSSNLAADKDTIASDPENHYYWRMNSRRMESQALRDSLLHLAGQLDLTQGGPSLKPGREVRRRSLYLFHSRDGRDQFLSSFDDAEVFSCYRRSESIVPQQALAMMNSREAIEAAGQIESTFNGSLTDSEFAEAAFLLILARQPSDNETQTCLSFLKDNPDRVQFVHALLNHNDFLVVR